MKKQKPAFLPLERISARTAMCSIVVGLGLVAPLVIVLACLPLPQTGDPAAQQQRYLDYAKHPGILFFKAVIIFPIVEEFFHRGVILQLLRRYCPDWCAVLFSAAFFGVTHLGQGMATALNAVLLGCFFAWLVIRSHSLYPSMLCHSAFNYSWLFLTIPYLELPEKMSQQQRSSLLSLVEMFSVWWILLSVALVGVGIRILSKELSKKWSRTSRELHRIQ